MDLANWHAAPPSSNLLAFWGKGVQLKKNTSFASLGKLPAGQVDWLSEPALEVTPYF